MLIRFEQVLGADQHFVEIFGLLFGQHAFGFAAHNAGEADDGIERRAQFVAHVGQEGALGGVGVLGVGARLLCGENRWALCRVAASARPWPGVIPPPHVYAW